MFTSENTMRIVNSCHHFPSFLTSKYILNSDFIFIKITFFPKQHMFNFIVMATKKAFIIFGILLKFFNTGKQRPLVRLY